MNRGELGGTSRELPGVEVTVITPYVKGGTEQEQEESPCQLYKFYILIMHVCFLNVRFS